MLSKVQLFTQAKKNKHKLTQISLSFLEVEINAHIIEIYFGENLDATAMIIFGQTQIEDACVYILAIPGIYATLPIISSSIIDHGRYKYKSWDSNKTETKIDKSANR